MDRNTIVDFATVIVGSKEAAKFDFDSEILFAAAVNILKEYIESDNGTNLDVTLQALQENLEPKTPLARLYDRCKPKNGCDEGAASDSVISAMADSGFTSDDEQVQTYMELGYLLCLSDAETAIGDTAEVRWERFIAQ